MYIYILIIINKNIARTTPTDELLYLVLFFNTVFENRGDRAAQFGSAYFITIVYTRRLRLWLLGRRRETPGLLLSSDDRHFLRISYRRR